MPTQWTHRKIHFSEIAEAFLANGAAVQVASAGQLEDTMVTLMGDPVRRARLGVYGYASHEI